MCFLSNFNQVFINKSRVTVQDGWFPMSIHIQGIFLVHTNNT
jgi:hypothetical protein